MGSKTHKPEKLAEAITIEIDLDTIGQHRASHIEAAFEEHAESLRNKGDNEFGQPEWDRRAKILEILAEEVHEEIFG